MAAMIADSLVLRERCGKIHSHHITAIAAPFTSPLVPYPTLLSTDNRIGWYSAMLGKKQSLKKLVGVLKAEGVKHITTTVFQGQGLQPGLGIGAGGAETGQGLQPGQVSGPGLENEQEQGGGLDDTGNDDVDDNDEKRQGSGLGRAEGGGGGGGRTRRWGLAWSFLPSPLDGNNNNNNNNSHNNNASFSIHSATQVHHPPSKTAPQPNNRRMRRLLAAAAKEQQQPSQQQQVHGQDKG